MGWSKKKYSKFVRALRIYVADLGYYHGGWMYYVVRMINNAFWLWLSFSFIWTWYHFAMASFGIEAEQLKSLRSILWVFGLCFMMFRNFTIYDFDKFGRIKRKE